MATQRRRITLADVTDPNVGWRQRGISSNVGRYLGNVRGPSTRIPGRDLIGPALQQAAKAAEQIGEMSQGQAQAESDAAAFEQQFALQSSNDALVQQWVSELNSAPVQIDPINGSVGPMKEGYQFPQFTSLQFEQQGTGVVLGSNKETLMAPSAKMAGRELSKAVAAGEIPEAGHPGGEQLSREMRGKLAGYEMVKQLTDYTGRVFIYDAEKGRTDASPEFAASVIWHQMKQNHPWMDPASGEYSPTSVNQAGAVFHDGMLRWRNRNQGTLNDSTASARRDQVFKTISEQVEQAINPESTQTEEDRQAITAAVSTEVSNMQDLLRSELGIRFKSGEVINWVKKMIDSNRSKFGDEDEHDPEELEEANDTVIAIFENVKVGNASLSDHEDWASVELYADRMSAGSQRTSGLGRSGHGRDYTRVFTHEDSPWGRMMVTMGDRLSDANRRGDDAAVNDIFRIGREQMKDYLVGLGKYSAPQRTEILRQFQTTFYNQAQGYTKPTNSQTLDDIHRIAYTGDPDGAQVELDEALKDGTLTYANTRILQNSIDELRKTTESRSVGTIYADREREYDAMRNTLTRSGLPVDVVNEALNQARSEWRNFGSAHQSAASKVFAEEGNTKAMIEGGDTYASSAQGTADFNKVMSPMLDLISKRDDQLTIITDAITKEVAITPKQWDLAKTYLGAAKVASLRDEHAKRVSPVKIRSQYRTEIEMTQGRLGIDLSHRALKSVTDPKLASEYVQNRGLIWFNSEVLKLSNDLSGKPRSGELFIEGLKKLEDQFRDKNDEWIQDFQALTNQEQSIQMTTGRMTKMDTAAQQEDQSQYGNELESYLQGSLDPQTHGALGDLRESLVAYYTGRRFGATRDDIGFWNRVKIGLSDSRVREAAAAIREDRDYSAWDAFWSTVLPAPIQVHSMPKEMVGTLDSLASRISSGFDQFGQLSKKSRNQMLLELDAMVPGGLNKRWSWKRMVSLPDEERPDIKPLSIPVFRGTEMNDLLNDKDEFYKVYQSLGFAKLDETKEPKDHPEVIRWAKTINAVNLQFGRPQIRGSK